MTGAKFITPDELIRLMPAIQKGECLLLDIRSPAEFRAGHIANAMLVPLEEIEKGTDNIERGKPLVIYCRTGKRCLRALPALTGRGREVIVLERGLERWPGRLVYE
jgi:rhodanese-related sulfurtransferase